MFPEQQVIEVLEGMHFPATKQELLDYAFRQFASEEVAHALNELPDIEYASPDSVEEVFRGVH